MLNGTTELQHTAETFDSPSTQVAQVSPATQPIITDEFDINAEPPALYVTPIDQSNLRCVKQSDPTQNGTPSNSSTPSIEITSTISSMQDNTSKPLSNSDDRSSPSVEIIPIIQVTEITDSPQITADDPVSTVDPYDEEDPPPLVVDLCEGRSPSVASSTDTGTVPGSALPFTSGSSTTSQDTVSEATATIQGIENVEVQSQSSNASETVALLPISSASEQVLAPPAPSTADSTPSTTPVVLVPAPSPAQPVAPRTLPVSSVASLQTTVSTPVKTTPAARVQPTLAAKPAPKHDPDPPPKKAIALATAVSHHSTTPQIANYSPIINTAMPQSHQPQAVHYMPMMTSGPHHPTHAGFQPMLFNMMPPMIGHPSMIIQPTYHMIPASSPHPTYQTQNTTTGSLYHPSFQHPSHPQMVSFAPPTSHAVSYPYPATSMATTILQNTSQPQPVEQQAIQSKAKTVAVKSKKAVVMKRIETSPIKPLLMKQSPQVSGATTTTAQSRILCPSPSSQKLPLSRISSTGTTNGVLNQIGPKKKKKPPANKTMQQQNVPSQPLSVQTSTTVSYQPVLSQQQVQPQSIQPEYAQQSYSQTNQTAQQSLQMCQQTVQQNPPPQQQATQLQPAPQSLQQSQQITTQSQQVQPHLQQSNQLSYQQTHQPIQHAQQTFQQCHQPNQQPQQTFQQTQQMQQPIQQTQQTLQQCHQPNQQSQQTFQQTHQPIQQAQQTYQQTQQTFQQTHQPIQQAQQTLQQSHQPIHQAHQTLQQTHQTKPQQPHQEPLQQNPPDCFPLPVSTPQYQTVDQFQDLDPGDKNYVSFTQQLLSSPSTTSTPSRTTSTISSSQSSVMHSNANSIPASIASTVSVAPSNNRPISTASVAPSSNKPVSSAPPVYLSNNRPVYSNDSVVHSNNRHVPFKSSVVHSNRSSSPPRQYYRPPQYQVTDALQVKTSCHTLGPHDSARVSPRDVPSTPPEVRKRPLEMEPKSGAPPVVSTEARAGEKKTDSGARGRGADQRRTGVVKPQRRKVLTHLIDNHVIYESNKPFPVKRGMEIVEAVLLGNLQLSHPMSSEEDERANESESSSTDLSDHEKRRRTEPTTSPHLQPVISPNVESETDSHPQTSSNPLTTSSHTPAVTSSDTPSVSTTNATRTGAHMNSPRPSVQSPYLPPQTPPPTPQSSAYLSQPMHTWTVNDVYDFVRQTPGCLAYAISFKSSEIDGEALLLLAEDQLIQPPISMKVGPALKLAARIEELR